MRAETNHNRRVTKQTADVFHWKCWRSALSPRSSVDRIAEELLSGTPDGGSLLELSRHLQPFKPTVKSINFLEKLLWLSDCERGT